VYGERGKVYFFWCGGCVVEAACELSCVDTHRSFSSLKQPDNHLFSVVTIKIETHNLILAAVAERKYCGIRCRVHRFKTTRKKKLNFFFQFFICLFVAPILRGGRVSKCAGQ